MRSRDDQLAIMNMESGEVEKVLLSGTRMDWSSLVPIFEDTLKQAGVGKPDLDEWRTGFVQGSAHILNLKFSSDGRFLFCATTQGLRVLAWDQLLSATETTPKPIFTALPCRETEPGVLDDRYYSNYIYDVILDDGQNRLLFCGIEGTIRFLHLNDGTSGVLLDPPGKSPICRLQLSTDRNFISCLCSPPTEERHNKTWRVQVWSYPALCRAKGLEPGLS